MSVDGRAEQVQGISDRMLCPRGMGPWQAGAHRLAVRFRDAAHGASKPFRDEDGDLPADNAAARARIGGVAEQVRDPEGPEEWQDAVEEADFWIGLDAARSYGLMTGPEVNVERCEELLARGAALGYKPRPTSVERVLARISRPVVEST